MTSKRDASEAAIKLLEGHIDPDSTAGQEILQGITERVLKETDPQGEARGKSRVEASGRF